MKRVLWILLRLLVGGVFLYAAYTKLRQPWLVFAMSIDSYRMLPEWAVLMIARVVPWLELAIGLMVVAGLWLRYSAAAASLMLLAFFGVMLYTYGRGMQIDCGCFGLGEALGPKTLARDGLLVAASVLLAWSGFRAGPAGSRG